jgi:hypothetical protein
MKREHLTPAGVTLAATAVVGATQHLGWEQMLLFALSQGGAALIVFKIMEVIIKLTRDQINANAKFYSAMALAFIVPVGAYLMQLLFQFVQWDPAGFIGAILIGYAVSQSIHWEQYGRASRASGQVR